MKQYTDLMLKDRNLLMNLIVNEHHKQIQKWGIQKRSSFEWLAYLTEEVGSLSKAISEYEYRNGTRAKVWHEAIQVTTLAIKIAEMFYYEPIKNSGE